MLQYAQGFDLKLFEVEAAQRVLSGHTGTCEFRREYSIRFLLNLEEMFRRPEMRTSVLYM